MKKNMIDQNNTFVVLDIETTGFSPTAHKITEIGAVKIEDGVIIEEFHQLIDPCVPIPGRITDLTGITSEMLENQPTIDEVLPLFFHFCKDCAIVAHNASFDMGFIKHNAREHGFECNYNIVDTLKLARHLFPKLINHKLNTVANHLNIELLNHHRAMGDARATAQIFLHCCNQLNN